MCHTIYKHIFLSQRGVKKAIQWVFRISLIHRSKKGPSESRWIYWQFGKRGKEHKTQSVSKVGEWTTVQYLRDAKVLFTFVYVSYDFKISETYFFESGSIYKIIWCLWYFVLKIVKGLGLWSQKLLGSNCHSDIHYLHDLGQVISSSLPQYFICKMGIVMAPTEWSGWEKEVMHVRYLTW